MILGPDGPSSGMLRIPDVLERDAGVYTCRAVNELGDASAEIRLEVGRECTPVPTRFALPPNREERTLPGSRPLWSLHHVDPKLLGTREVRGKLCVHYILPCHKLPPKLCGLKQ